MAEASPFRTRIAGIENYFPDQIITNQDLAKVVETNDEWIQERTGIRQRRRSAPHETPAYMGTQAALRLLNRLQVSADSIDLIIVATITSDYTFPASACLVQAELNARNAFAFDLSAACSGYLYGLEMARGQINSGLCNRVLLIAAEKMSAIIDPLDRTTCIIFGDGGSATLLERSTDDSQIIDSLLRTDGSGVPCLFMPAGGSRKPPSEESVRAREHFVKQEGKSVFKRAVVDMASICSEILEKNHLKGSDLKLFVPHQANIRIMDAAAERMQLPREKMAINIDRYGNTTAATIPTALQECIEQKRVGRGDLVLLASFGAGFTWGACLLKL